MNIIIVQSSLSQHVKPDALVNSLNIHLAELDIEEKAPSFGRHVLTGHANNP